MGGQVKNARGREVEQPPLGGVWAEEKLSLR
jgi:hypothetical protein